MILYYCFHENEQPIVLYKRLPIISLRQFMKQSIQIISYFGKIIFPE